jgi:hypothetical protein
MKGIPDILAWGLVALMALSGIVFTAFGGRTFG